MRAPTDWLNQYLSHNVSTERMAEALESVGIEVEQILYAPKLDEQIIVAEIKKVAQHPNAERLKIATIDAGSGEIELVCGAPNLEIGHLAAWVQPGSKLPDGTKIKEAAIRGQGSPGMLASAQELGLSVDHSGLYYLPDDAKLGSPVRELVSASDVIDVATQANRFDLLSLIGLAREIAAFTGVELKMPPDSDLGEPGDDLAVEIEAPEAVSRYMLAHLSLDQRHGTAPWAKSQLEAAGLRSLGLGVDITNYTMIELCQPLHAFDAHKVKLPIKVRFAKSGEGLETLDGAKRKLTTQDLLITDATGPIALAGVMGGASTEVSPETTEILLESATFDAATIRKMAQRHGLRSEASGRFERGLVPRLAELGLRRALFSFQMAAGAKQIGTISDRRTKAEEVHTITADPEHISKVTSLAVSGEDLTKQLAKFGFETTPVGAAVEVTVPWWRPDVKIQEDLAEEYIRLVGFDGVEARIPRYQPKQAPRDDYWARLWQTKAALKGLGLFEVITYSFIAKDQLENLGYKATDHLKLANPMSSEQAYLRTNLLPSLMASAVRNQGYRAQFGLYEVSRVFEPTKAGEQPTEPTHLAVLCKSPKEGYRWVKRALDALVIDHQLELEMSPNHDDRMIPGRSAAIKHGQKAIGWIGELHPKYLSEFKTKTSVGYLEIDLLALWAAARPKLYRPISRFPSLWRDLAVIVPAKVMWQDVARAITETSLATPSFLNDYYDLSLGENHKSLAMRLEMSSLTGTLTDKEAKARLAKIEALLADRFGAKTRS